MTLVPRLFLVVISVLFAVISTSEQTLESPLLSDFIQLHANSIYIVIVALVPGIRLVTIAAEAETETATYYKYKHLAHLEISISC